jgi:hypothetical protein
MRQEVALRPLAAIATELCREVEQAEQHWQSAVAHAIRAGQLLVEAKTQVKHGEWLPWLGANFPGSVRTAQGYMRLAAHAEDAQRLAHLGVAGALNELSAPRLASGHLGVAAENIALGDEAMAKAEDSCLAYMFGCEQPVPDRIRQAFSLMVGSKSKEDWIGGDAIKERLEAAKTTQEGFAAERTALAAEIAHLVPEFNDLAWRIGLEERTAEVLRSIREVNDAKREAE